jgi:hypothetical protein
MMVILRVARRLDDMIFGFCIRDSISKKKRFLVWMLLVLCVLVKLRPLFAYIERSWRDGLSGRDNLKHQPLYRFTTSVFSMR